MLVSRGSGLLIGRWLNTSLKIKPDELVLHRTEVIFYTRSKIKIHVIKMLIIWTSFPEKLAYPTRTKTGTRRLTRWTGTWNAEHNVV